jgi:hypothetical protein
VARRFGTVATFYKFAVIDGVIPAIPTATVAGCSGCVKGNNPTAACAETFCQLSVPGRTLDVGL